MLSYVRRAHCVLIVSSHTVGVYFLRRMSIGVGFEGFKSDEQSFYNRVEVILREMMLRGLLRPMIDPENFDMMSVTIDDAGGQAGAAELPKDPEAADRSFGKRLNGICPEFLGVSPPSTPGQVPPGDKSTSSARLGTLAESLSKMNGYGRFLQVRRRIYEITAWRPDSRDKEGRYGAVQY
ncbi:hypothetical protein OIDMADRAFT_26334 [Oidiodendron maius Zn]|uniref:Uncharacterized protein n=1 Tax=Oidiodendron maius (strain Zn) TaxID=913774 RepID=A0A0C3HKW7_OIDMZ|nr:hypothetical protein OIDMADRAFT_26334 [Oidiodendron maius Zn]